MVSVVLYHPIENNFITGENFISTEKIDGSNIGIGFVNDCLQVQSRNEVIDIDTCKKFGLRNIVQPLIKKIQSMKSFVGESERNFMVFGEIFGNGKLMKYDDSEASSKAFGCKTVFFRAFDIYDVEKKIFWKYTDAVKIFEQVGLPYVPVLKYLKDSKDWEDLPKSVEQCKSAYSEFPVEGFVIKKNEYEPIYERNIFKVKREQFKSPDPRKWKKNEAVSFDGEIEKFVDENRFFSACSKTGKENLEEIKKEMTEDVLKDLTSFLRDRVVKQVEKYVRENADQLLQKL